ncbi:thiol-disulfide oxidoreductase DCC family protein [Pseudoalteromonas sp. GB56]
MLTLFYDGACPLCAREISALKNHDVANTLVLVDINDAEHMSKYPAVSYDAAYRTLHAIDASGNVLRGLDANVAAWNCVGKMRWLNMLRAPVVRTLADWVYSLFATLRPIFGAQRCQSWRCRGGKP